MFKVIGFLWLDPTAWTAIGTLVALVIALGWIDWIKSYFRRPALTFECRHFGEFSSRVNGNFWLRVPISNASGKRAAKNVEVFLEGAAKINQEGASKIVGFVPMRLRWCHTMSPVCDSIPPDSFRLLSIGCVQLRATTRLTEDTVEIEFPSFIFDGEVQTEAHSPLAMGVFELTLSITAEETPKTTFKVQVIIRKVNETRGLPAKIEMVRNH